jgi:hypothetical protein
MERVPARQFISFFKYPPSPPLWKASSQRPVRRINLDSGTPATWTLEGNKIYVDHDGKRWTYKIEGDDLLDSRGNRWIRTH